MNPWHSVLKYSMIYKVWLNCKRYNRDSLWVIFTSLSNLQLSPLKGSPCLGLLKSQSLCLLPGAGGSWRNADMAPRRESLSRRLTSSNCSLREAVSNNHTSACTTGTKSSNSDTTSEEKMCRFKICLWIVCICEIENTILSIAINVKHIV